jgi:hypothetical protein
MNASLFEADILRGASFSAGRDYRYSLFRRWGNADRMVNFIMLNPSTADEYTNDPTVERCEVRARSMGYGGLVVTNIFAWRSTDPRVLKTLPDPIGPDNDAAILDHASRAALVICAWGKDGALLGRGASVKRLLRDFDLHALRVSEKTGEPWHPLYLGYECQPVMFAPKSGGEATA